VVAADVLWSDPVMEPGIQENVQRGVGLTFGPDITQVLCLFLYVCGGRRGGGEGGAVVGEGGCRGGSNI
jgi:hypothetical protein